MVHSSQTATSLLQSRIELPRTPGNLPKPRLRTCKRLGDKGLFATLYAGIRTDMLDAPFMRDFLLTAKDTSFATLEGVSAARG